VPNTLTTYDVLSESEKRWDGVSLDPADYRTLTALQADVLHSRRLVDLAADILRGRMIDLIQAEALLVAFDPQPF
jgi:hypothetical protein